VIDLPDSVTFAAALADRRFIAAAGISALSGLVRGFSGFGSALIYMPLVAAVYDPRIAAATLLLIDFVSTAPYTVPEFRRCTWREVLPISLATIIAIPFGTAALLLVDPVALRWGIAFLVLGLLAVLVAGWRFHSKPRLPLTTGVGLFAGFGAGAVQIAGPAVIVYWLSTGASAATLRANLMVYFAICDAVLVMSYFLQGVFTVEGLVLSLLLGIPFLIAVGVGAHFFHGTSDQLYRRVAYVIIALAALLSLPIFDHVLH
jgi:uncharacterized membrane protein YfcA